MNEIAVLSDDINVITAEINAYQRVAGEAIFEIGRRLHEVKYNPLKFGLPSGTDKEGRTIVARGAWGEWLIEIGIEDSVARRFIIIHTELGEGKRVTGHDRLGIKALYEISQLAPEQRGQPHTIPSTGETKTVDEMTVRELREVKAELRKVKEELATTSKPETVVVEKEVERIVEVDKTDYSAVERLKAYEERFGALENYSDRARATNVDDVTTSIISFNMAVRDFIKRHAYLLKYQDTIQYVDKLTQREYDEAVAALKTIAADFGKVTGNSDFVDVEFCEVQ